MSTNAKSSPVRDAILQAAASLPKGTIDELVHFDNDLSMLLITDSNWPQLYLDVPVDRVIALSRRDFIHPRDTWRSIVSNLTCEDWKTDVFQYFDSPLQHNRFPPDTSTYEMRLDCMGGACQVGIGNHRIVAGRAWLTAKYGNAARWREAKVRYWPLSAPGRTMLEKASLANCGLRVASLRSDAGIVSFKGERVTRFAALSNAPLRVHALGASKLWAVSMPLRTRLFRTLQVGYFKDMSWCEIPVDVVRYMLDDKWITAQLPTAAVAPP